MWDIRVTLDCRKQKFRGFELRSCPTCKEITMMGIFQLAERTKHRSTGNEYDGGILVPYCLRCNSLLTGLEVDKHRFIYELSYEYGKWVKE